MSRHRGPAEPRAHQDNVRAVRRVAKIAILFLLAGLGLGLSLGLPGHAQVKHAAVRPVKHTAPPVIKPVTKKAVLTYTTREGDTLWGIAQSQCGNGNDWHAIYRANTRVITDWNLIQPGMRLVITCGRG